VLERFALLLRSNKEEKIVLLDNIPATNLKCIKIVTVIKTVI